MRLVLAALSRPITVVVALIAVALCAGLAIQRMPVDIFPQVGDPVIYVAQTYGVRPAGMRDLKSDVRSVKQRLRAELSV